MSGCDCLLCRTNDRQKKEGKRIAEACAPSGTFVNAGSLKVAVAMLMAQIIDGQPKGTQLADIADIGAAAMKICAVSAKVDGQQHGPLH